MSISDRLAAITTRAESATAAPWRVGGEGSEGARVYTDSGDKRADSRPLLKVGGREQPEDGHNAEFIAHARSDVPWLVEQVRKRDAALQAVLDVCDKALSVKLSESKEGDAAMAAFASVTRRAIEAALGEEA